MSWSKVLPNTVKANRIALQIKTKNARTISDAMMMKMMEEGVIEPLP